VQLGGVATGMWGFRGFGAAELETGNFFVFLEQLYWGGLSQVVCVDRTCGFCGHFSVALSSIACCTQLSA